MPSGSPSTERRTIPGLRLDGDSFDELQDYSNTIFTGPVIFRNVRFTVGCKFDGAIFQERVNFSNVQSLTAKGASTSFIGCRFEKIARFDRSTLYLANFSNAAFEGVASFRNVRFLASARFDSAKFREPATFIDAEFNGLGSFNEVAFAKSATFTGAVFRYWLSHARFNKSSFGELAGFDRCQFSGLAEFAEAVFKAGATFAGARFTERLDDGGSSNGTQPSPTARAAANRADLSVDFSGASFSPSHEGELVSFENAKVGDRNFARDAVFDKAVFHSAAGKALSGVEANFNGFDCYGGFSLHQAHFMQGVDARFDGSKFSQDVDLIEASFDGRVSFQKSQFRQGVILAGTKFCDVPEFTQASFVHEPTLHQATLPKVLPTHSKAEKAELLQRIRTLKRIAAKADDKRTANAMLIHELKLEGGFASGMYGLISSYGQSWVRPAMWLVVLAVLVFPVIHLAIHGRLPSTVEDARVAATSLSLPCAPKAEGNALAAAIELSIKNAMVVATDNEARFKRITECLGASDKPGLLPVMAAALEATQIVLSAVLVFFVGASVRRRLQVR